MNQDDLRRTIDQYNPDEIFYLFDLDGTLVDTVDLHEAIYGDIFQSHKIKQPANFRSRLEELLGKPHEQIWEELGIHGYQDPQIIEEFAERLPDHQHTIDVSEDTIRYLDLLHNNNIFMSILTTASLPQVDAYLEQIRIKGNHFGIQLPPNLLKHVYHGDDDHAKKPSADSILTPLSHFQSETQPSKALTIMIGDSNSDMIAVNNTQYLLSKSNNEYNRIPLKVYGICIKPNQHADLELDGPKELHNTFKDLYS